VQRAWEYNGLQYTVSELIKSELYLEYLPLFTQGLVSLPDHPHLLRELRLLERRTHRSGRDTVDHGRSGSDDYANSVCGVLHELNTRLAMVDVLDNDVEQEPVQWRHAGDQQAARIWWEAITVASRDG
jgi:hypothetical protein